MLRRIMGVLLAFAMLATVAETADAAAKKARAPKARKPTLEETIRKAVDEAIKDSVPAASGKFEFVAKRMRPPKNKKWTKRWNTLGQEGWQMVGNNENIYIFQRPGSVDLAAADNKKSSKAAATNDKKAQKAADKAAKTAQKQADKDAKAAAKAAEKAAKQAAKSSATK